MLDIIIPVYNVNRYIKKCIDSVIDISGTNIIVVNDGSVEDPSFLKGIYEGHSNFKYYEKKNGGLSDARNFGMDKSTSEYIMFLDGDDYVETEKLEQVIKDMKNKKEKACLFFYRYHFEDNGKFEDESVSEYFLKEKYADIEDEEFRRNPPVMVAWRYIVKREILIKNKLYFHSGIYHEDEEWSTKLWCCVKRMRIYPEFIYNYRQRQGSIISKSGYKHVMDIFKIIRELDRFKKGLNESCKIEVIENKKRELFHAGLMRSVEIKFDKDQMKEYSDFYKNILNKVKLKYRVMKYLPYSFMRLILQIKAGIKG